MPNVLPSVSKKYPCQHTPGTANFGNATFLFCATSSTAPMRYNVVHEDRGL